MMTKVNNITSARALQLQRAVAQPQTQIQPQKSVQFGDLLQKEIGRQNNVQFSKHASQRVEQRGIELTDNLLKNLNDAVQKARAKGARDVAVIGEKGAFIVNVPNNVVVTTMSQTEMKENIFTNIDSAVLM